MRKVFDILLIATILVGVVYACSSDYFEPYEESFVYNAYDPREELILITDSIPLESSVETLAIGESIVDMDLIKKVPIYSNSISGVSFSIIARIDYHIDSTGITIKGKNTYLDVDRVPYPQWTQYSFSIHNISDHDNSTPLRRTCCIDVSGVLDTSELYGDGKTHTEPVNIRQQVINL